MTVATQTARGSQYRQPDQRSICPQLPADEGQPGQDGASQCRDGHVVVPGVFSGVYASVGEQRGRGRRQDGAGDVEPDPLRDPQIADRDEGERGRDEHEGHVDEQHPAPVEVLGQQTAQQHAERASAGGDHTPGGQRPAPLGTIRDAYHDHGQCQWGQYGRRHPLGGSGGDELPGAVGEAAEDGGDTEQGQRGEHGAPVADQIGDSSTQQQQATEGQGVGTDHPRQ